MSHRSRISEIIEKYLRHVELSPDEQFVLDRWIEEGHGIEPSDTTSSVQNPSPIDLAEQSRERTFDKIQDRLTLGNPKQFSSPEGSRAPSRRSWFASSRAAALVILVLVAVALLVVPMKRHDVLDTQAADRTPPGSLLPARQRATLKLGDGSIIALDSAGHTSIALGSGLPAISDSAGRIRYVSNTSLMTKSQYNELSTPAAGQYSVMLPDSSIAWLNNMSSIRYAIGQTSNRTVEVSGEVYLHVRPDPNRPFIIKIGGDGPVLPKKVIQVLGTDLDLQLYPDEVHNEVTVVTGSIRIMGGHTPLTVTGGSGARLAANGNDHLVQVTDPAGVGSWRNGYFVFRNASLEETMRTVARWYGIKIIYMGKMADTRFSGKIQTGLPLSVLLTAMEDDHLHFTFKDNTLEVAP